MPLAGIQFQVSSASTVTPRFQGDVTLPSFTATGEVINGAVGTADVSIPPLNASGSGITGEVASLNKSLPSLQAFGLGGTTADITLPSLTATGTGLAGEVATVSATLPALTADGSFGKDTTANAAAVLPKLVTAGTIVNGADAVGASTLPKLTATGTAETGVTVSGGITLPGPMVSSAEMISEGLLTASVVLPKLSVVAEHGLQSGLTATAWSMNTENFATTNYLNYDFLALGELSSGVFVGITPTGIYTLAGDDDAGTFIDAEVLSGKESFGNEFEKNIPNVYLGYTADGDMVVMSCVDGEESPREYEVRHKANETGITRARATLGKGIKSRYWQTGFKNCNGADFEIESLGMLVRQLKRKV